MSNRIQTALAVPRMLVACRVLIAVVGGYALAAAISQIAAHFSELTGREQRSLLYLVFFSCYGLAIIWLFAIPRHRSALLSMLAANACAWGSLWWLGGLA